jgi:hypothetical protein
VFLLGIALLGRSSISDHEDPNAKEKRSWTRNSEFLTDLKKDLFSSSQKHADPGAHYKAKYGVGDDNDSERRA